MYRIEVSAPTINELSGKLAALASQLRGLPSTIDVSPVKAEEQPVVTITPEPTVEAVPAPEPKKPEPKKPEPKADEGRVYDYATDVAPRVLEMVAKRTRDDVVALLQTFGVKRAKDLDPSRFGELMAAVDKAMED